MSTTRLEAFSDGVMAIIITIMVLELRVPDGTDLNVLRPLLPQLLSYVLSFVYIGIYWNNHHHLFQITRTARGGVLWANLHLLFWLSLLPFVTGWMGENHFAATPTAIYGCVLLMAAVAYGILVQVIVRGEGSGSEVAQAIGRDIKGWGSVVAYAIGIVLSVLAPWVAQAIYALVAIAWLIPDRRIERTLAT